MCTSTFPTKLSTVTWLGNPFTILMLGLLLVGKPFPLQLTAPAERLQPATCRLAALIGTFIACRSAIASGMLSAQSRVFVKAPNRHVGVGGAIVTIEGLVTPPN